MKLRLACAGLLALLFGGAHQARADSIVTACEVDTQPGGLAQALAVGGVIFINCPSSSPLRITQAYDVPRDTMIHGNGTAVLHGRDFRGTFLRSAGGKLTLRRITLRQFSRFHFARPPPGGLALVQTRGSVVDADGELELDQVSIETSEGPVTGDAAMRVSDSRFTGNTGVVISGGSGGLGLIIRNSAFVSNQAAINLRAGQVINSSFADQTGGAISVVHAAGAVEIRHSVFRGTRGGPAILLSQRTGPGGAEPVQVRANQFVDNTDGAIRIYDSVAAMPAVLRPRLLTYPPASFRLSYNRFQRNSRGAPGGAIEADLANTGGLVLSAGLFVENTAPFGGAVAIRNGQALIAQSIFKGNAATDGAAIFVDDGATVTLANSLVAANRGPGPAVTLGSGRLINVTVADNEGTGVSRRFTSGGLAIRNSIVSKNRRGNCNGLDPSAIVAPNVQFGAGDCPGMPVTDPFLDQLFVPAPGSPVLTLGDIATCKAEPVGGADLLFHLRDKPAACALGAYEAPPLSRLPRPRERPPRVDEVRDPMPEGLAGVVPSLSAEPSPAARDALIGAVVAEAEAPSRRATVTLERETHRTLTLVERVGRDRLRIVNRTGAGTYEAVVVGSEMVWRRMGGAWTRGAVPRDAAPAAPLALKTLFETGLGAVAETGSRSAGGRAERVLTARIRWSNGGIRSTGTLEAAIETASGRPTEIIFRGSCGNARCAFHQQIEYAPLVIELPGAP